MFKSGLTYLYFQTFLIDLRWKLTKKKSFFDVFEMNVTLHWLFPWILLWSSEVVKSAPELHAAYNQNSVLTDQPFSHLPLSQQGLEDISKAILPSMAFSGLLNLTGPWAKLHKTFERIRNVSVVFPLLFPALFLFFCQISKSFFWFKWQKSFDQVINYLYLLYYHIYPLAVNIHQPLTF